MTAIGLMAFLLGVATGSPHSTILGAVLMFASIAHHDRPRR